MVVNKPAALPIHPCGGYNFNSLFEILSHWKQDLYGPGNLFTIHRLDRLTSGLVLIAKSSALARSLGKCIMDRDGCEKIYLSKVKGHFPLNLQKMDGIGDDNNNHHPWEYFPPDCENDKHLIQPPCQYWEVSESNAKAWRGGSQTPLIINEKNKKNKKSYSKGAINESITQSYAGLGYWMSDGCGPFADNAQLQDLIDQCDNMSTEEMLAGAIGSTPVTGNNHISSKSSIKWLNFSCPCRILSHKNGVCEAGSFSELKSESDRKGIKPAQTSFTLLSYDASSDTSLVLAKPVTGRTHQIRLHLQKLGHPVANDQCYGGEMWFGDEEGKMFCKRSREWLDRLDRGETKATTASDNSGTADGVCKTNADTPATDVEIYHAAANRPKEEGESMSDFIKKTCVWCARCRGVDDLGASNDSSESKLENEKTVFRRTLMEYFVRSQGIWLHALQYGLEINDETGQKKTLCYRTKLPSWATM